MSVTAKSARIDKPNGSHHFGIEYGKESKEELYPVLEIELPRVGTVRAQFSADRYVHSSGWSEWRIYARNVEPSAGVGDAARAAINAAGKPLIEEWLASDAYKVSRARVIAFAIVRTLYERSTADYTIKETRRLLSLYRHELTDADASNIGAALDALEIASRHLDAVGK